MTTRLFTLALSFIACKMAHAEPLKVYILAGQSNMEGHAHVKTFKHVATDPESNSLAALMLDGNGEARSAERTWISYIGAKDGEEVIKEGKLTAGFGAPVKGPKIGPEYTFGLTLEKHVKNPILLIKTAWGGRSLSGNFRPPSCRPITEADLTDAEKNALTSKGQLLEDSLKKANEKAGVEYQWMVDHVKDVLANIERVYPGYDPKQGYEIAGFVWFQGFNDLVNKFTYPNREAPDGFKEYTRLLTHFIRDVRKDFDAPEMPFVIGVMGLGGPIDRETADIYKIRQQNLRDAMAAPASLPEFKGTVHAVLTEKCWDAQLGAIDEKWEKLKGINKGIQGKKDLSKEQIRAELDAARNKMFTKEELELRDLATSNAGYHYLGSAKIMGRIGVAFADALAPEK
jgi:alpha-galactosidase